MDLVQMRNPVDLDCERCGSRIDVLRWNERAGALQASKRWRPVGDAPRRGVSGLPQVVRYGCRRCHWVGVVSVAEVEDAVVLALRSGQQSIRVGVDVNGYQRGERIRREVSAKAPRPGMYNRANLAASLGE